MDGMATIGITERPPSAFEPIRPMLRTIGGWMMNGGTVELGPRGQLMASGELGSRPIDVRGSHGVQIGDGNLQFNIIAARPEVHRPWMSPALTGPVIGRPDLYAALFDSVLRDDAEPTTLTTAVEGSGGFGKTTLAAMLCHDKRVDAHFTGGLLWVTVGERSRDARLAQLIGGLCEVLTGDPVTTANPEAAGGRLGELLDAHGRVLLVVDDVWRPEQLAPFMIGGRSCRRLITTRNAGVAPRSGVSILVDVMTTGQAVTTLTKGVGEVAEDLLARLVLGTGCWPLLLSLVNAALVDQIAAGADVEHAVRWVLRRLEADGPAVFDVDLGDEDNRSHAVRATMETSLASLTPCERDRYLDLAVLPEDTPLPIGLLLRLWRLAGMSASEAEQLHMALVRLRLVLPDWQNDEPAVRLHDVLGAYLRHQLTDEQIVRRHELMVRAAAEPLQPAPYGKTPWWSMPADARYLWHHLPYHLAHSGRVEEHDALVVDLRWVAAKATNLLSSVPVEIDLADMPSEVGTSLRRALGAIAELVTRGDPPSALDATLYCYLHAVPGLSEVIAAHRAHLSAPQLAPAWPLPDQPGSRMLRTLTGHSYGVSQCAFSPDGKLVATASHDTTVRVWEVETGRLVKILTGHTGPVSACEFSPDGTTLATAGHDTTVRIWHVATGTHHDVLSGHSGPVTSCSFAPHGGLLATTSDDQTIRLWAPATGTPVRILTGHVGAVRAGVFSPDGTLLVSAGEDHTVRAWEVATGTEQAVLSGHSGAVTSCAFSPVDDTVVASTGDDGTVRIWDIPTRRQVRVLAGHEDEVLACAFSPDGALLASGGCDLTAHVWEVATGAQRTVFAGHSEAVSSCAFSPDGTLLATASHDWRLRLWRTGARFDQSPYQVTWEYTCAFSPDGATLATAGHSRAVRIWDVASGGLRTTLHGHTDTISGCAFSLDAALLATASHDHTTRIWDMATGATRTILNGHTEEVTDCAFSPDGALIASAAHDDTVRLWDTVTGEPVRVLTGHSGAVSSCAFSPDGNTIASASHDHTVRLWDLGTGPTPAVLSGHTDIVTSCAFSPDGTVVVSASHDRTCKVWDIASGRLRQTLARHASGVTSCAFTPDGALLTTEIGEHRLRMWRLGSDEPWCGLRVVAPLLDLAWHPRQPLLCAVGEAGVYLLRYLPHGVQDAE